MPNQRPSRHIAPTEGARNTGSGARNAGAHSAGAGDGAHVARGSSHNAGVGAHAAEKAAAERAARRAARRAGAEKAAAAEAAAEAAAAANSGYHMHEFSANPYGGNYDNPYIDPYAAPAEGSYASPSDPYGDFYENPYANPYEDSFEPPYANPYEDPYASPRTPSHVSPYENSHGGAYAEGTQRLTPLRQESSDHAASASKRDTAASCGQTQARRTASAPSFVPSQPQPRKSKGKTALKSIGIILLTIVVILGIAFGTFAFLVDSALEENYDRNITPALTPVPASEPFYTLIIGSDSREGNITSNKESELGDNQRSDVIILARFDLPERKITMISVPRDTPYRMPDGPLLKINELYNLGGGSEAVRAVESVTGVKIAHFIGIEISDLEGIVNALGGVTVNVPIELSYNDALTGDFVELQPGEQVLDGQQAQIFARSRHEYGGNQDAARQSSVRSLATAIVNKLMATPPLEMPGKVLEISHYMNTDIRTLDMASMAWSYFWGHGKLQIYSGTGPTEGGINPENELWLCYEDPEGWAKLMATVNAGGDPS